MAPFRFIYYLSISVLCATKLTYTMFDQQELLHIINVATIHDSILPENIVKRLQEVSNENKFMLARMILAKTNEHVRAVTHAYLKELIVRSFQPHELYTQKKLELTCWRQWINVQRNSQGGYYQTTPDDIHRLFECYELPQSLEHYTELNKNIYKYFELDPARRYTRSRPVSNEEIGDLLQKLQELRCTLYESLKQELLNNYGIILTAEPVKSEYNCTFKACLKLGTRAQQKLQEYIDKQLASK